MKRKWLFFLSVLFAPFILYFLSAVILGLIQIERSAPETTAIFPVYVVEGDIHTEFLIPLKNELADFSEVLPIDKVVLDPSKINFIAVGWGSKEFFFEMQTWDDVKFGVILRSILRAPESVMHVEFIQSLPKDLRLYSLRVDKKAYLNLADFILKSFAYDKEGKVLQQGEFSYYGNDRFYLSSKRYHFLSTCNTWTNEGLKVMEEKRPLWSPFKYAIVHALKNK